ncbi:MAG: 4-(cytidine 5'-diphospho)-2-C-methyl-D-erythritol kinase [Candidatus Izemoplasmatales bacterium]
MIEERAYAKVNLFLNVSSKRKDGYHSLEMLNTKIDLCDVLEFKKIDVPETVIIKSNDLFLSNQENIVIQVAKYMIRNYNIQSGLEIKIDKKIPFGAGLAGNSADSAAVIKGISKLFNLNLTLENMIDIGMMFGADIPYCLFDKTAFVSGIGEVIEEVALDFSDYQLLLINPLEFIGTKDVFDLVDKNGVLTRDISAIKDYVYNNNIEKLKNNIFNSLEDIVVENYSFMKNFKEILVDKLGSSGLIMTGSGSSYVKIIKRNEDFSGFINDFKDEFLIKIHNFL